MKRKWKAWVGFSDGKPYVWAPEKNDKPSEYCCFNNRAIARKSFEDVRRVEIREIGKS